MKEKDCNKKCKNKIFSVSDNETLYFLQRKQSLIFSLGNNRFAHKHCNKLPYKSCQSMRALQIEQFTKNLNQLSSVWKCTNLILDNEKLTTLLNMISSISGCQTKTNDLFICNICKKLISVDTVRKHKTKCFIKQCSFKHVDGSLCNINNHKQQLHNSFISYHDLSEGGFSNIDNDLLQFLKNDDNNIFIHKTKEYLSIISYIANSFNEKFSIFSKHCSCFEKFKKCNCFRYFLNNLQIESYKIKRNKNVYLTLKDIDSCKVSFLFIVVSKQSYPKSKDLSFFDNYRKNRKIKYMIIFDTD